MDNGMFDLMDSGRTSRSVDALVLFYIFALASYDKYVFFFRLCVAVIVIIEVYHTISIILF